MNTELFELLMMIVPTDTHGQKQISRMNEHINYYD